MSFPIWIALIHYAISITGIVQSAFVVGIILMKTPAKMRSYSVLILSLTVTQLSICFSSCILFCRLIPVGTSLLAAINGPISYVRSDQFCYYLWFFMMHGHGNFSITLTLCFLYRNYVLFKPTPKLLTAIILVLGAYAPTLLLMGTSALAPIASQQFILELLRKDRPWYEFDQDQLFFGTEYVLLPQYLIGFLWITNSTTPCYIIIIITGRKIYKTLGANLIHMSESTKASHREIIKGLVIQSILPAFYCLSLYSYVVGQFDIVISPTLEYFTHIFGELTPAMAPFMTLIFVKPYRETVKSMFSRSVSSTNSVRPVV